MATRRATKKYLSEPSFIQDYDDNIRKNTITLSSSDYRGELADIIKLDIQFVDKQRVGPIEAHVIFRGDEGVVALRLMDVPQRIGERYQEHKDAVEAQKQALIEQALSTGKVILTDEHNLAISSLQDEISELKEQLRLITKRFEQLERSGTTRRGFQIPHLTGREPIARGAMGQWVSFLTQVQSNQYTGVARIEAYGVIRYGLFKEGAIVAWKSDPAVEEETLGQLLLQGERIDKDQLTAALNTMRDSEQRLGQILQNMGVMDESEVLGALHSQMLWIFQKVLSFQQGTFGFYPFDSLPELYPWESVQPIVQLYTRYRQTASTMDLQQLAAQLKSVQNQRVVASDTLVQFMDSIEWTDNEKKWVKSFIENERTISQMLKIAGFAQAELTVLLWSLLQMQMVQFVAPQQTVSPIVYRLQEKLKQIRGGSHFDVLEVHWISTRTEIEAKYQRLISDLNVQGDAKIPITLQELIPEILQGVYQAYSALLDDTSRRQYRSLIVEDSDIKQAAALLGEQGKQALNKGDKRHALQCFTKALELQPQVSEYTEGMRVAVQR